MNRLRPTPALRLFRGHSSVFEPYLIKEVAVSVPTSSPCCRGNRIDNGGKIALACPQSLFSLFAVLDICACTVPFDDLARFVAERLGTNEKPAINPIMATKTRLDLIWFT